MPSKPEPGYSGSNPHGGIVEPTIEHRPWGSYLLYIENEPCTVKRVDIAPWSALSLQFHEHRAQRYIILAQMTIEWSSEPVPAGMYEKDAILDWYMAHKLCKFVGINDELFFDRRVIHRPHNDSNVQVSFIEVAYGRNDEEDITRLADRYGRA